MLASMGLSFNVHRFQGDVLPERMDRALGQPTRYAASPLPPGGVSPLNRLANSLFNLGIFKRARKRLGGRPDSIVSRLVGWTDPEANSVDTFFFGATFFTFSPRGRASTGFYGARTS